MNSIWIGFDIREAAAFAVAKQTAAQSLNTPIPIYGVELEHLREKGLYTRPTSFRDGVAWDEISEAPMSTEFAISRFLTPQLAGRGWALFMDADVLVRRSLDKLFALADDQYAVMCVKHPPSAAGYLDGASKMDGQLQTNYARKNWSSVMLFNCGHPANDRLTVGMINSVPGRDLHRFCWLEDHEIGEIPPEWNYLVGVSTPQINPAVVHFTLGIPTMKGYEHQCFADEWRAALRRWASIDRWPRI